MLTFAEAPRFAGLAWIRPASPGLEEEEPAFEGGLSMVAGARFELTTFGL